MADERIEVEWIATANKMVQVLDRLEGKFDKQERQLEKLTTTSKKNAEAAAGSFNALEQELKQAEAALKGMAAGTDAFAAQKKKVDALRDSLKQAKGSIQGAAGGFGQTLSAGVGQIKNMVAGMVTLQAVVTAITSELEKVAQLRAQSAEQTRTFEQAIAAMALNIGAANVPEARRQIIERAPELGVSPEGLANLISSAISGGAQDLDEAIKLSADVLKVTAGDAAKAAPIMSGMLSIAGATGQRDFQATLGQLSQFQAAARGEDLATSINNMSTALAAANTRGERIAALGSERTLELASTMSQILQDPRMAVTGTALRQMVQKMDAFVAQKEMKLDDGTVQKLTKQQIDAFNQLGTLDERLSAMRADPALARQFLSTIENSEGKVAIRQLVMGEQSTLDLEKRSAELITGAQGGQQEFQNLAAEVSNQTALSRAEAKSQAALAVGDITGERGVAGQVEKIVNDTLGRINLSGIDFDTAFTVRNRMRLAEAQGLSAPEIGIAGLQETLQQRRLFGAIPIGGNLSDQDRAIVEQQIALLQQIRDEMAAARQQPMKVQAPPMRPKEAPLPAATAP
jgi:hypothetical protein